MDVRKLCTAVLIMIIVFLNACNVGNRNIEMIKNGVVVKIDSLNIKIQFYSDNIVRVVKWFPSGTDKKLSLSVVVTRIPRVKYRMEKDSEKISIETSAMTLKINRKNGSIVYDNNDGKTILAEFGRPVFEPFKDKYENSFHISQKFILNDADGIYGLGQHQYGYMNYRGKKVVLVQSNTDAVNPFLISTGNFGMLWDNYSKTIFEDKEQYMQMWSDVGDNIDYYFICGKSMDDVIKGYRYLTGDAPLYGKWVYGYWQSKEHYDTQEEILSVARKYRKLKIPIDNIIQDWRYWGDNEKWSGMIFDPVRYPDPDTMVRELHDLNFHLMISIWPGLGQNTEIYKEMKKYGYLYNIVGWANFKYYDAFNPAANDIYWKYLKKGLYDKGIDAFWIDSTEPDIVNATTKESQEYEMKKVGKCYLGSWARYLNAYSLVMMDALYKKLRNVTDRKRVYLLTRSAFAGQQRTAATTWSGDIGASWDIYRKQISAGLNFCMSGIPYWTFDIGAFVIGAYGGVFINGGKDPSYQELYTRMFQFGAFCPIFRAHGSETPREIWEFGEFTDILIKFVNLRYRLLPYIYSIAWKVTSEGYTYMRGLAMDFPDDLDTYDIDDEYMFGPSMLICPVTTYMYYKPPEHSILITPEHFMTKDGERGVFAKYFIDSDFKIQSHTQIEPCINHMWYTGRPEYMTDSAFSVIWEGYLIPNETGKHQFHLISYDYKNIYINGRKLDYVYTSVEQYTEPIFLKSGKKYDFRLELQNRSTGAAKMKLYWKTPSIFTREKQNVERFKIRNVYLPRSNLWYDFWTGNVYQGGQMIVAEAPIDKIPIYIKAGSILPMGPFIEFADQKPADPIEIRIYPGKDSRFTLYEDEGDGYNYEMGIYSTIDFIWDDENKTLTIDKRKGSYPGMLKERTFNVVIVVSGKGVGVEETKNPTKTIKYKGKRLIVRF